ncbi:MAG: DUF99 family protein [Desulfobacterales bacterium]|nr:DUF99 family protein [Desulfobacterales bacterium]MBS3756655.1 DUF99 family protein [Desulfobacterales bacterium]
MKEKRLSNVAGFDDAPFDRGHQGSVPIVGTVYADLRFDGVLVGEIEKDGSDSARKLGDLIAGSRFAEHVQFVMLQGIAFGGFNVVDVFALHRRLGVPVLAVSRKLPDMEAVKNALLAQVDHGRKKWQIIEQLGAMEPVENVYVQRLGLTLEQAAAAINRFSIHGNIPEPLRTAHLIATALECGQSRGNP